MMAESMPFCGSAGTLTGIELEAWYEDLQDILCSDAKNAGVLPSGSDEQMLQVETVDSSLQVWTLESLGSPIPINFTEEEAVALEAVVEQLPSEWLEFLNQESQNDFDISSISEPINIQQRGALELDSGCSSSQSQTLTEDEESSGSQSATKRKRNACRRGGKVRVKEKEQENEKQVAYLVAENDRLKGEIDRLSLEVEQTRKSLIERMVNLKKV
ncbi:DNA damage-inducible transcript 3 protein [Pseudophryne corroboree]|uniref:DNA damage-inducible transcript 3 protein n=1 Tax=Pseudophryne corroboree TaxID=495146 RepID=UPI003081934E